MSTVYAQLLAKGWTAEQIEAEVKTSEHHTSPRTFTVVMADTPDGDPIVAISYTNDYKYEEEAGVGTLRKAVFKLDRKGRPVGGVNPEHVTRFLDRNSLVISTEVLVNEHQWGTDLERRDPHWHNPIAVHEQDYHRDYKISRDGSLGLTGWEFNYMKVDRLKEKAFEAGIKPIPRKKDDLVASLKEKQVPLYPNRWPGWFQNGKTLVLRAESGLAADVLNILYAESRDGNLTFGSASGVFSSGMNIYTLSDIGPKLKKQREASVRWHDKQMKKLKPVEAALKKEGYNWYALGNPTDGFESLVGRDEPVNPKEVRYWLNGHGILGLGQPYGWYSLKELREHKFVEDLKNRKDQ